MNVGMLWFDGDVTRDVPERIHRAAEYYRTKYGRQPNVCILHPVSAGEGMPGEVEGLKVLTSATVLRDHFWLGVDEGRA